MSSRLTTLLQRARKSSPSAVLVNVEGEHLTFESLQEEVGLLSAHHISVNTEPYARTSKLVLGFSSEEYARAFIHKHVSPPSSWSIVLPAQRDMSVAVQRHLGV